MGMGNRKASMPRKCMAQIPIPMAAEPPNSQRRATLSGDFATRPAMSNAVYDAKMAVISEANTSQGLYVPLNKHLSSGLQKLVLKHPMRLHFERSRGPGRAHDPRGSLRRENPSGDAMGAVNALDL